jgi:hypothetical protein
VLGGAGGAGAGEIAAATATATATAATATATATAAAADGYNNNITDNALIHHNRTLGNGADNNNGYTMYA